MENSEFFNKFLKIWVYAGVPSFAWPTTRFVTFTFFWACDTCMSWKLHTGGYNEIQTSIN